VVLRKACRQIKAWGCRLLFRPAIAAPTVILASPSNGSTFTSPASIGLYAAVIESDPSAVIVQVNFYTNFTTLIGLTQTAPYLASWNNVSTGSYVITAQAINSKGEVASSNPAMVQVTGNLPPTVSLTAPANNASFTGPADITLSADAADSDGTEPPRLSWRPVSVSHAGVA